MVSKVISKVISKSVVTRSDRADCVFHPAFEIEFELEWGLGLGLD